MTARNYLSVWRAAVAAVAVAVSAGPASAGLTLAYSGPGGAGILDFGGTPAQPGADDPTGGQVAATEGRIRFRGYTFDYVVSSSFTNGVQSITLEGTLTGRAEANRNRQFAFVLSGGQYTAPTGTASVVTSTLSGSFVDPTRRSQVVTRAAVGGNDPTSLLMLDRSNADDGPLTTSRDNGVLEAPFNLTSVNASISGAGAGSVVKFKATASVQASVNAFPEPAGIAAGLAGLPCVGAVLAFARRRVGGAAV